MKCCIFSNVIFLFLLISCVESSKLRRRTNDDKGGKKIIAADTTSGSRSGREPSLVKKGEPKLKSKTRTSGKQLKQQTNQRMTLRARTTLLMNDQDRNCIAPAEAIFFEDTWKAAYKTIQDDQGEMMDIRSVVIEGDQASLVNQHQKARNRHLHSDDMTSASAVTNAVSSQNRRSLQGQSKYFFLFTPSFYFDIWSIIEVTCYLCSEDRRLQDVVVEEAENGIKHKEINGRFEMLLCDMLRKGPYDCFQSVESCQVTFVSTWKDLYWQLGILCDNWRVSWSPRN